MNDRHLSDDRLIDICVARSAEPDEEGHLIACARCAARRTEVVGVLRELDDAATYEADGAFPEPRLERQHARILQRVDQEGRPAELLTFPAPAKRTRMLVRSRPRIRWAAAAAAAAFIAGVLTGRLTYDFSMGRQAEPVRIFATETEPASLHAVSTTFSEDEFLGQIELAASNPPPALRPLDAMTPRVR